MIRKSLFVEGLENRTRTLCQVEEGFSSGLLDGMTGGGRLGNWSVMVEEEKEESAWGWGEQEVALETVTEGELISIVDENKPKRNYLDIIIDEYGIKINILS